MWAPSLLPPVVMETSHQAWKMSGTRKRKNYEVKTVADLPSCVVIETSHWAGTYQGGREGNKKGFNQKKRPTQLFLSLDKLKWRPVYNVHTIFIPNTPPMQCEPYKVSYFRALIGNPILVPSPWERDMI